MLPADSVQPADDTAAELHTTLRAPVRGSMPPLPGLTPSGPSSPLRAFRTQPPTANPLDLLPSSANIPAAGFGVDPDELPSSSVMALHVDPAELLFLALRFLQAGPCGGGEAVRRLIHEAQEKGALPTTTDYLGEGKGRGGGEAVKRLIRKAQEWGASPSTDCLGEGGEGGTSWVKGRVGRRSHAGPIYIHPFLFVLYLHSCCPCPSTHPHGSQNPPPSSCPHSGRTRTLSYAEMCARMPHVAHTSLPALLGQLLQSRHEAHPELQLGGRGMLESRGSRV